MTLDAKLMTFLSENNLSSLAATCLSERITSLDTLLALSDADLVLIGFKQGDLVPIRKKRHQETPLMGPPCARCLRSVCGRFPVDVTGITSTMNRYNTLQGIFMAEAGAGKTTIFNLVCNANRDTSPAEHSVTRDMAELRTQYGQAAFSVVDTPATNADIECYKHAYFMYSALTARNYNAIFIVLKYDPPYCHMQAQFRTQVARLLTFKSLVVVLVSHWDMAKDHKNEKVVITRVLSDVIKTRVIFYSATHSCPTELANELSAAMAVAPPQAVTLDKDTFLLTFPLMEVHAMRKVQGDHLRKANEVTREFEKISQASQGIPSNERDDFLHALIIAHKTNLDAMKTDFHREHGPDMNAMDFYMYYVDLQKEMLMLSSKFSENVSALMTWKLDDKSDVRNQIKRCPHCELVWVKVEGCDGATTCGNDTFTGTWTNDNGFAAPWFKYSFSWSSIKRGWGWERNTPPSKRPVSASQKSLRTNNTKKQGCGKAINWGQLPKLSDDELRDLFDVSSLDELQAFFKNADVMQARRGMETKLGDEASKMMAPRT